MPIAALKSRYSALSDRVVGSLSEVERRDVRAFEGWFYHQGGWRWILVIVGVATAAAWVAAQLPWNMSFAEAAILFNGVVLMLVWSGLTAWFGYPRSPASSFASSSPARCWRWPALMGASIAGLITGVAPLDWLQDSAKLRHVVMAGLLFGFLYALIVALIAHLRNREYAALTANLEAEARQSALSRQLAESKLRLLQQQIEPHFLFNTLGSAQQLAEKSAPEAARLIADLIRFLRASTPAMRDDVATLQQEGSLVAAYLSIMQRRLGARLAFTVEIPAALGELIVPPGMLITLVENAIKHGIEPSPDGGSIHVAAAPRRGRWPAPDPAVADTGRGLTESPGQGSASPTSASDWRCSTRDAPR
ncbi:MAG: histidine kinase [Betaproteobacteria bacterium]|nr:histidine kinase [Betaproteobacteria bacterium]